MPFTIVRQDITKIKVDSASPCSAVPEGWNAEIQADYKKRKDRA